MDKAPSHTAPRRGRAGCRPCPASDSLCASLRRAAPQQAVALVAALGCRHRTRSLSLITGGQAGDSGAVRELGKIEMLWIKAENSAVTGEGRPSRAGEKQGVALCNWDTAGQFVSLLRTSCAA